MKRWLNERVAGISADASLLTARWRFAVELANFFLTIERDTRIVELRSPFLLHFVTSKSNIERVAGIGPATSPWKGDI